MCNVVVVSLGVTQSLSQPLYGVDRECQDKADFPALPDPRCFASGTKTNGILTSVSFEAFRVL